jgi:hypothetical protein
MVAKSFRDVFKEVKKDLRKSATDSIRNTAVEIMNDLVIQGPAYSGGFSSAWYTVIPGTEPGGVRREGSQYKYTLRNVPKRRFAEGKYYEIVNGADYAPQALDLEEGVFFSQRDSNGELIEPVKAPVIGGKGRGTRTGRKRGNVSSGGGDAISTAPLDWYVNYTKGGGMTRALEQGVELGFRQGPFGGSTRSRGFA